MNLEQQALSLYHDGEYKKALPLLKQALLESNSVLCALPYGDICRRNLDQEGYRLREAALCYLHAAEFDDGDACAYLNSISPLLIQAEVKEEDKLNLLVECWQKEIDSGLARELENCKVSS